MVSRPSDTNLRLGIQEPFQSRNRAGQHGNPHERNRQYRHSLLQPRNIHRLRELPTGKREYYDDAKHALDFGRASLTSNGIFSNSANYLNTWADEFARVAGHFVRDNRLWDEYHEWMKSNADANRRADLGITWNGWDKPTEVNDTFTSTKLVTALAWLQFTPETVPSEVGDIHTIVNKKTGLAIDSAGTFGNGKGVVQWGTNDSLNQRWLLTQNADSSWNVVNLATWKSLYCPGGSGADGTKLVQWTSTRDGNQRWVIEAQDDSSFKMTNQASGKVLDGASDAENGTENGWNGNEGQRWFLQ